MVKRVLITGGLGYVGGRIAQFLWQTGRFQISITSRKAQEIPLPGIRVIPINYEQDDFTPLLKGVDAVIHLAATNEIDSVEYPYRAIDVNIKFTLKWLKAAEQANCQKFIYFSTVHVYGSPLKGLIIESTLPRPTHPYSITHKAAEDYVLASRDRTDLDAIVLRLSNAFGAPLLPQVNRWSLLVNDLCRQVVEANRMVLRSNGLQLRDFISLLDVCQVTNYLLMLDKEGTKDGLFNLSSGKSLTILEMANSIISACQIVLGITPELIVNVSDFTIPQRELSIDNSKLLSTGCSLTSTHEQALQDTIQFCKTHFTNT